MNNPPPTVYSSPELFGLTLIGELPASFAFRLATPSDSSLGWRLNLYALFAVWKDSHDQFWWGKHQSWTADPPFSAVTSKAALRPATPQQIIRAARRWSHCYTPKHGWAPVDPQNVESLIRKVCLSSLDM